MTAPTATITLLTSLASGALAAVRIFGSGVDSLLERLLDSKCDRELFLARVLDPQTNETIDQAIVRRLPGRLGAEMTLHGGVRIVQRTLVACEALGAVRLDPSQAADRDELWRQSLALARAEGLDRPALWADVELTLPRARTRAVASWIAGQWSGGVGSLIETSTKETTPNDKPVTVTGQLETLLREYEARKKTIDGIRVAIVGPANAGKSTLFNRLLSKDAAIVSNQPGTTRDYVSQWASLAGLAVELIDTAGLRALANDLESRAFAAAAGVVAEADLRLIVLDATDRLSDEDRQVVEKLAGLGPAVWLANKSDAISPRAFSSEDGAQPFSAVSHAESERSGNGRGEPADSLPSGGWSGRAESIAISAATGAGIDELIAAIARALGLPSLDTDAPGLFADRQVDLIRRAIDSPQPRAALAELLRGPEERQAEQRQGGLPA